MLCLQGVEVQVNVPRQWMAGREILSLEEDTAVRAVELDDPDPLWVKGKIVVRVIGKGKVDLARIALAEEAALLVGLAGGGEITAAAVATPHLSLEIDVEGLGDPDAHGAYAGRKRGTVNPSGEGPKVALTGIPTETASGEHSTIWLRSRTPSWSSTRART